MAQEESKQHVPNQILVTTFVVPSYANSKLDKDGVNLIIFP